MKGEFTVKGTINLGFEWKELAFQWTKLHHEFDQVEAQCKAGKITLDETEKKKEQLRDKMNKISLALDALEDPE